MVFQIKMENYAVFDREYKANEGNPEDLRNAKNDYLQGVFLDGTPVKEISFESELEGGVDSYNINEFDIDLGVNNEGHIYGRSIPTRTSIFIYIIHEGCKRRFIWTKNYRLKNS